jgi:hypothetical protein
MKSSAKARQPQETPWPGLLLIALAWIYVVVLMAATEALGPQGTILGACFTLLGYGVLPLSVVLYIGTSRLRRQARERAAAAMAGSSTSDASPAPRPGTGVTPGSAIREGSADAKR